MFLDVLVVAKSKVFPSKTEFTHEIMQLHTAYEQMVGQIVQFPKAGQTNVALLQFIEQLAVDMSLIEPTHSQLRGYIEVRYAGDKYQGS